MKRSALFLFLCLVCLSTLSVAHSADPILIEYSNVSIDKTSISTGQTINVTFDLRSTGLPVGSQPNVFLELVDQSSECEEECGSSFVKLISGSLSQGKWGASLSVGSGLPSGTYRVVIFFAKLKGVKGALYYDNKNLVLSNASALQKPSAGPISISYSNVTVDKKEIGAGQSIKVTFDMRSSGVPDGLQPTVFLELADQSFECEEECGRLNIKQVAGNISQGKWEANLTVGSGLPSGKYRIVIFTPKLKGVNGALYYDNRNLILTNTATPTKPSVEPSEKKPSQTFDAKAKPTPSASSLAKSITIYCTKGKVVKKVTALKPKCPSGYKVKK